MNEQPTAVHPHCVECGYDLHGLGEAVRCPECGRVNVPEAYRREVWELVDRGRWFFSSPFQLFRKRPPGWWWSLDRPGDVRRSYRYAATCLIISTSVLCVTVALGDCLACKSQWSYMYMHPDPISVETLKKDVYEYRIGLCGILRDYRVYTIEVPLPKKAPARRGTLTVAALRFLPSWGSIIPCLLIVPALLATWFGPALVGLCTQIRKGLPRFARAPATVVAACNYEAHRLVYVSILTAAWVVLDVLLRRPVAQWNAGVTGVAPVVAVIAALMVPAFLIMLYGALGWVGALRSDFTKMLIQSRWHATRIILMYAIGLPLVTLFCVGSLLALVDLGYFQI